MKATPAESNNLWNKVLISPFSECWEWMAYKNITGYGTIRYGGKKRMAHRAMWHELIGPIPEGKYLDHICRNRGCVNPAHLRPVTPRENVLFNSLSPFALNLAKTHCKRGHEFTPENTMKPKGRPGRWCRICHNAKGRARALRIKQQRGHNEPRYVSKVEQK